MRVIFDHGVPHPLALMLKDCEVATAPAMGWDLLANGKLLAAAIAAGFGAMVTTDRNMAHQQNLSSLPIGLVILSRNDWRRIPFGRVGPPLSRRFLRSGRGKQWKS